MSFNHILEHVKTPVDFTYLGIGSAPHARSVDMYDDIWDQLIPVFVRDQAHKTRRIIHFDPAFTYSIEFAKIYFATYYPELIYHKMDTYHRFTSSRIEVFLVEEPLEFKNKFYEREENHEWFVEALSNSVLENNGQLVVQDFTGREMDDVFKRVYEKSSDKALFKRKVLFDITYGHASCMTDLTKNKPIYDSKGDFMNFLLYSPREIIIAIGKNERLDQLIKEHFVKKFRESLNIHHVNYRRRSKGETCLYKCDLYNDTSKPELIMGYLQNELADNFLILKELGAFTDEKEHEYRYLMKYYERVNMYDWNTAVSRLV